jgi:hypothetical protein
MIVASNMITNQHSRTTMRLGGLKESVKDVVNQDFGGSGGKGRREVDEAGHDFA